MSAFEAARNWDLNNSKPRAWNFEGCSKGANKKLAAIFRQASSSKATAEFRPQGASFGWVTALQRAICAKSKAEQYFQRREKASWHADVRVIKEAGWSRPRAAAGRSTTTST